MTDADHHELLDAVHGLAGMVIVCGYRSALYDDALRHWQRHETQSRASAQRGCTNRTEVVWLNPACSAALQATSQQPSLLAAE